jgi:cellulose synthase/poly-beta-1,6-N-acetylglucosamine synthase-like glycosyltransferase
MYLRSDALQCRYLCVEDTSNPRAALAQVAFFGWNLIRPLGRSRLGLSVGILGNGFALRRETLQRVPYDAASIVEDVEYHIRLLRAGLTVQWVDQATLRAAAAPDRRAATTQRARWTGGRLALLKTELLPSLRAVLDGQWRMLDVLGDLLLPPLSLLLIGAAALLAWPCTIVSLGAAMVLAVILLHVFIALYRGHAKRGHWLALLRLPAYLLWSLISLPYTLHLARRNARWTRTPRDSSSGDFR